MDIFADEYSSKLFNALVDGTGFSELLQVASLYLQNPIVLCDTSFSILESSSDHNNKIDFEFRNSRWFLTTDGVMTLYNKKIVDKLFKVHHAFISERAELNKKFMFCSVWIKRSVVGYLCLIESSRKFIENDYRFVELLSQIISLEMQKAEVFTNKTGFKYEYFMTELINGDFTDLESAIKRYRLLGRETFPYYRMFVFSEESDPYSKISKNLIMEQLVSILSNSMASYYKGNLVLLVSRREKLIFMPDEKERLLNFLTLNQMRVGVSYEYSDILQTHLYYEQAKQILDIQLKNSSESIIYFEEHCIQSLAMQKSSPKQLDSLIHPDIKYLKEYDHLNNTEYLSTLLAYLKNDRNVHKVSVFLNIHKSTYFYRMNKISELLNVDLNQSNKLFAYEVSLRFLDLL